MLVRLLRDNKILAALFSAILLFFYWFIPAYYSNYNPGDRMFYRSAIFYMFPEIGQADNFQALASLFNVMLLLINSIYISKIIIRYQAIPQRSSLHQFMFILLSSPYFAFYSGISPVLVSLFFFLITFDLLFQAIDIKATSRRFFDMALVLSVASFFSFYVIFFNVFLFFAWLHYRGIARWRELVYIIIGAILPYFFLFSAFYLSDIKFNGFFKQFFYYPGLVLQSNAYKHALIPGIFSGAIILLTSVHILQQYMKMKIVNRKYSLAFMALFINALLIAFFYRGIETDFIFFIIFPLSFLFSFYFSTCRYSIFNQLLLILLIVANIFVFFI
ncbi:MAG: hypothetical protein JXB34_01880 [Bacteroidales bacterium]|nr:hypothetical protein [Bacteroidales bacterium]